MSKIKGTKRNNNQNQNNRNIKHKAETTSDEVKKGIESAAIEDSKVTDIKTFGSDKDYIVVELVGTYRNMWNYVQKQKTIQRLKENKEEVEVIPIEFTLEESREFEFLFAQIDKLYLDGALADKTQANVLKFADRKGEDFSNAMLELISLNALNVGKLRAQILLINTLDRL